MKPRIKKPHASFDCPCTSCQEWYRDENSRLRSVLAEKMSELASNVQVSYCPACQKLREEAPAQRGGT